MTFSPAVCLHLLLLVLFYFLVLSSQSDAIDEAEDRDRWMALLQRLDIKQPAGGMARSEHEAFDKAHQLGYPVMIRPSYVLGGR